MKRYCQTLELRNNAELIEAYIREHKHVWPEIKQGIREVGILNMEIYIHQNLLFMIVDTVDSFDWAKDMLRLSTLPRQQEREAYMSRFQDAAKEASSAEKWQLMDCIFQL